MIAAKNRIRWRTLGRVALGMAEDSPFVEFDARVDEVPDPSPGAGEMKVKIAYCGLCGTDPEVFNGSFGLMRSPIWPLYCWKLEKEYCA